MDKVWIWFPELGHKLARDKAKRSGRATRAHQGTGGKRCGRGQTVTPMGSKKKKKGGKQVSDLPQQESCIKK